MRQNIDEKWKTDPRRKQLDKRLGPRGSDGMRVEVNWLLLEHRGKPIPLREFKHLDNYQDWIDCELGRVIGDSVVIAGADEYSDFFKKQKTNGKKGGRPKQTQTNPKKPKPTQANPGNPSSSSSFSVSSSFSPSISNSSNSTPKVSDFVAAYCNRFKDRWGESPPITGKDAGIAKRLAKGMGLERFEILLDAFFQMPDALLVKNKHPLNHFELKLNEIAVFAGQGLFTTNKESKQADEMATNYQLLQKIQRGEI